MFHYNINIVFSYDFQQPNWHHFNCFFSKYTPTCIDEMYHFHDLRWEDQERVKNKIEGGGGGKNKRRVLKNYSVQYALSSKSNCAKCHEKIEKVNQEVLIIRSQVHCWPSTEIKLHIEIKILTLVSAGNNDLSALIPPTIGPAKF